MEYNILELLKITIIITVTSITNIRVLLRHIFNLRLITNHIHFIRRRSTPNVYMLYILSCDQHIFTPHGRYIFECLLITALILRNIESASGLIKHRADIARSRTGDTS